MGYNFFPFCSLQPFSIPVLEVVSPVSSFTYFYFQSDGLCLLMGTFRLPAFTVITDIFGF